MASCNSCSLLLERLSLLEERVRQLEQSNFVTIDVAGTPDSVGCSQPTSLVSISPKRPANRGEPIQTHNSYTPLESPTMSQSTGSRTLVIGDSITRNIKLKNPATVMCIPGARAPDIEASLRELTRNRSKHQHKANNTSFSDIVIHVGSNDTMMRQSEITKRNIARTCNLARKMCRHRVVVSGPLPARGNDERFSRLFSLNRWLAGFCNEQGFQFVDNWPSFWRNPRLFGRDGLHPNREGALTLSRNIDYCLSPT
uniref:uncharacterized protein LOC131101565 n=1 Tax=Doryrhamphus excisus TaxID=161450 RepID=UPI0025AE11C9|nr:uncharacterized protein LOC131101565 [Doryrhamphus excisus]